MEYTRACPFCDQPLGVVIHDGESWPGNQLAWQKYDCLRGKDGARIVAARSPFLRNLRTFKTILTARTRVDFLYHEWAIFPVESRHPEDSMRQNRFERARKVGLISYISKIADGTEADAVLTGVKDTGNRAGWDPQYEFVMEISTAEGGSFETRFRRIIPAGLVPNFQLGRPFRVIFDPEDHSQVSFVSCRTENGELIDFRAFPLRLRKMEDTEMIPESSENKKT